MQSRRVLIVDDEPTVAEVVSNYLEVKTSEWQRPHSTRRGIRRHRHLHPSPLGPSKAFKPAARHSTDGVSP